LGLIPITHSSLSNLERDSALIELNPISNKNPADLKSITKEKREREKDENRMKSIN
jgi:hypothetical protein